ncbi:MAG: asparagine synthase B [Thermoanaerobacteraceae bacterium]
MAGIALINRKDQHKNIEKMLDKIKHRGPDAKEIFVNNKISIGYISIKDENSRIFKDENDRYICIFDGEIYNYDSLLKGLQNHNFATELNGEIILHLYEEIGPECVKYLDGIFSFIIYDTRENNLFIARDPLGIKPLYYGKTEKGDFVFASEIKALIEITEDINEFPNGYFYTTEKGFEKYYVFPQDPIDYLDTEGIIEGLRLRLEDSVKKRIDNKDIGVFLSGGLDSSLIASIASKYKKPLISFAVGVHGSNDLKNASLVADYLGFNHIEFAYTEKDIKQILPTVIYHLESCDPALVRSAVATYFASKLASNYVNTVFSGEGADELFAGYHYLKRYKTPWDLHYELKFITNSMHNTNFQRVDRMTMSNSINARVPFLDYEVIRYAFKIIPSIKIRGKDKTEKWVLRKLSESYLPKEIVWRKKEKFSIGSGTAFILENIAEEEISDKEFLMNRRQKNGFEIKSKEELYYFKILNSFFNTDAFLKSMGRSRSLWDNQIYASEN